MKIAIIGSGLSGATCAAYLKQKGHRIHVFETRPYIGGNCYDELDPITGVRIHKHGPHAFHTSNEKVWDFITQFSTFNDFRLKVKGRLANGQIVPVPFNLLSEELTGRKDASFIKSNIFEPYSKKMWGVKNLSELPISISNRVPQFRDSYNCDYHLDKYQGNPKYGYEEMFAEMLSGKNVNVYLNCEKNEWRKWTRGGKYDLVIYTGPIDSYFKYKYGKLAYRSIKFEYDYNVPRTDFVQLNECNEINEWTRQIDHSHWEGGKGFNTVISREFPEDYVEGKNLQFYPMGFKNNSQEKFNRYSLLTKGENNVIFLGRLASYKYLDMHIIIGAVLQKMEKID